MNYSVVDWTPTSSSWYTTQYKGTPVVLPKTFPEPTKVIFNPPATIVFWKDGTKTVVKCMEGKEFNKWDGLAMAICKKYYGSNFKKEFRKWCGR